ncbi:MAG: flavin reductase family protein [Planctomycetota bacterium]
MAEFDPEQLQPLERYKLMGGSIVPRPIGWVSTVSASGDVNLAPFSYCNAVSAHPMCVQFCPANKPDGSMKDTLANALPEVEGGTGEFVLNIVSEPLVQQMAATAEPLPPAENEFTFAGLDPASSVNVAPPRVANAMVAFECRTMHVIQLAKGEPAGGNLVLGEVVYVHTADGLVNERFHVDAAMLAAVGRMGGLDYATTRHRFTLPAGSKALEHPSPLAEPASDRA